MNISFIMKIKIDKKKFQKKGSPVLSRCHGNQKTSRDSNLHNPQKKSECDFEFNQSLLRLESEHGPGEIFLHDERPTRTRSRLLLVLQTCDRETVRPFVRSSVCPLFRRSVRPSVCSFTSRFRLRTN